jgi:predicted phosphodiesterase
MRLQPMSDLHLEFHRDGGQAFLAALEPRAEVLVLAGDIVPLRSVGPARALLAGFAAKFPDVVYVPGNHEYYGTSPARAEAVLEEAAAGIANLHVLNPGVVELHGTRFVGAPLWFPPTPDEELYRRFVSDFASIDDFVPWVHETHAAHLAFLEAEVRAGDVVVTHHLPHGRSVSPMFAGSPSNRFFVAAGAAPLVTNRLARVWIHGHTHTPCDYVEAGTRVVCNPLGYPGERKPAFAQGLVVELAGGPAQST